MLWVHCWECWFFQLFVAGKIEEYYKAGIVLGTFLFPFSSPQTSYYWIDFTSKIPTVPLSLSLCCSGTKDIMQRKTSRTHAILPRSWEGTRGSFHWVICKICQEGLRFAHLSTEMYLYSHGSHAYRYECTKHLINKSKLVSIGDFFSSISFILDWQVKQRCFSMNNLRIGLESGRRNCTAPKDQSHRQRVE